MRSFQFPICLAAVLSTCLLAGQALETPRPVSRVTFHAPSVARDMACNIILPAGYESSGKRYPVLYLLHGRNGDLDAWPRMGVPKYAAKYDLIVVMPDAGNSWYVNWAQSDAGQKNDWADYIVHDLIGYVDANYRTIARRSGRAIDGYSMGGFGALYLAFSHPELFCSVNSHSGGLRIVERWRQGLEAAGGHEVDDRLEPVTPASAGAPRQTSVQTPATSLKGVAPKGRILLSAAQIDAHDPFQLVLAAPKDQLPDIRLDCGIDESLAEYSQKFANLLIEHQIPFSFAQAPGRHNADTWSAAVEHSMAHQYAVMMNELGGGLPSGALRQGDR